MVGVPTLQIPKLSPLLCLCESETCRTQPYAPPHVPFSLLFSALRLKKQNCKIMLCNIKPRYVIQNKVCYTMQKPFASSSMLCGPCISRARVCIKINFCSPELTESKLNHFPPILPTQGVFFLRSLLAELCPPSGLKNKWVSIKGGAGGRRGLFLFKELLQL